MAHLSPTAIGIVQQKFQSAFIDKQAQKTMGTIEPLIKEVHHRPLHPSSLRHKEARKLLIKRLVEFSADHEHIDLSLEIDKVQKELGNAQEGDTQVA